MALKLWFGFLTVSFLVSVLTLNVVQTSLIRREGWSVFRRRRPIQLYWRELSPVQRWLLYPGIAAFFVTWLAGMAIVLTRYITEHGHHI